MCQCTCLGMTTSELFISDGNTDTHYFIPQNQHLRFGTFSFKHMNQPIVNVRLGLWIKFYSEDFLNNPMYKSKHLHNTSVLLNFNEWLCNNTGCRESFMVKVMHQQLALPRALVSQWCILKRSVEPQHFYRNRTTHKKRKKKDWNEVQCVHTRL